MMCMGHLFPARARLSRSAVAASIAVIASLATACGGSGSKFCDIAETFAERPLENAQPADEMGVLVTELGDLANAADSELKGDIEQVRDALKAQVDGKEPAVSASEYAAARGRIEGVVQARCGIRLTGDAETSSQTTIAGVFDDQ